MRGILLTLIFLNILYFGWKFAEDNQAVDNAATSGGYAKQVPTLVRAVCGHGPDGRWRAGGLMLQSLPKDKDEDKAADDWNTAEHLARTVKPQELLDIGLPAKDLLYRLFHEEGVWAHDEEPLRDQCTCDAERVVEVVSRFPKAEVADLVDESGKVSVTCKFCSRTYGFEPEELIGAE